jgi:dipeptidyl aminopeptidase/acylaminoacyl peptidase
MKALHVLNVGTLLFVTAASLAAQQRPDRITLEHSLSFETASGAEISPDGRQIIYTRGWINRSKDSRESTLWVMDADGSRPRALVDGSSPIWSPDGSRIAYLAKGEPSGTQIWVRYMDAEGAATQITRLERSPSNISWAPDGRSIAFTQFVPSRGGWTVQLPDRPRGATWTEAPRVVDQLVYRRERTGFLEDGFEHIFLVPSEGGAPRQVTSGDYNHGAPEWTPDGRSLLFSGLRTPDAEYSWRESEIYSVDTSSGVINQLTNRRGRDFAPAVSPDGRRVVYLGHDSTGATYQDAELYVMDIDGGNVRRIAPSLNRAPQAPLMWSSNGREIYFNVPSEGSTNLHVADLNGRVRQVTSGVHDLRVTSLSRAGQFAGVRSAPTEPSQIVSVTARNPSPRTLTRLNESLLEGVELGEVEEIWYTAPDGLRIQGWIVKPPQFDASTKYPMQLHIHGGPHAMYGVGFNFGWQEHAANDYVVLYTNPRGSTGYGSDFGNAIKNAYPGLDYDDLMAGVDLLVSRGYVDESNMFVTGCSGGGVLTAWIVGQTDRFRAASANCPVTNWLSFVGTTDGASWYHNFEKFPWEDPTEHLRRSPLMYVGNVTTPTMLMTGVLDLRTPIAQTEEYYQALKMRRVPTAMIRFNEEWHGTSSKPSNFMRTQLYLRSWFERWMTEDGLQKRRAGTTTTRQAAPSN